MNKYLILDMANPKNSYVTNVLTSDILYGQEDGTIVVLAKHYNEMTDF